MNTGQITMTDSDRGVVLRATDLRKTFYTTQPPAQVLNGIDLTVDDGEFLVIMGASGSGKSTLLYNLSGMDSPTDGSVRIGGHQLRNLDDRHMSTLRLTEMGFVFQQPYFLANLNIRDNVLLPALKAAERTRLDPGHGTESARSIKTAEAVKITDGPEKGGRAKRRRAIEGRVDALLRRFGIEHIKTHGTTEVSGGQLQRAAICRALATEPAILFADEPTGALNSAMSGEVMDAITQAHRDGTTVVMVTHDPACAARADRVVYLRDGKIVDTWSAPPWQAEYAASREDRVARWLNGLGF